MAYQFLRGTTAENDAYTGPEGSFTVDTEKGYIRLHDGVTQGGMATITNLSSITTMLTDYPLKANNLSDLDSSATARTNLGLGTAATESDTKYAHRANNLSDLGSASTARSNLGLGTAATNNDSDYVRTDQNGSINGTLEVQNQMNIKNAGNRHLYFRDDLGNEDALIHHAEAGQYLSARLRNGGGGTLSELRLQADGDIRAITGQFAGTGSGLTDLSSPAVRTALAFSQENQVGTYGFMKNLSGSAINPGQTLTGADLQFANNIAGSSSYNVTGTWRCMGYAAADQATLFLKIS